jgi:phosphatidylinositol glycan class B
MLFLAPEDARFKRLIRNCLLFSLLWHIVASVFSLGYHHLDEHFQILEFAGYKLGTTPAIYLPWEFAARLRPTIQPAFVVLLHKITGADPFTDVFLLRLISSLLGFCSSAILLVLGLKWLKDDNSKKILILGTSLFWFFPYLHAHFSAESISGSLFFLGLALIWQAKEKDRNLFLVLGGLLLGTAFVCRYQTGFLILGLAAWAVFVARFSFKKLLMLALPILFMALVGVLIDHWFYGEWVCTLWNYFKVNLIEGKAAEYGVSPWWYYFYWNFTDLVPPFSIVLIAGLILAMFKRPKNIVSMSVIPFLLVHILISHKEPRFLFPLANALPVMVAMGLGPFLQNLTKRRKLWKTGINIFWAANILLMIGSSVRPASDYFTFYEFVYKNYNGKSATMLCSSRYPYDLSGLTIVFYQPRSMHFFEYLNDKKTDSIISKPIPGPLLVLCQGQKEADNFQIKHPKAKLVFSSIPQWMHYINVNDWISRTRLWVLFEVKN